MSAAPVIDCDVHCAIPSPSMLYPYLPDMWCEHIELNAFKGSAAIGNTYPAWNPSVRTAGVELTLDRLQADVLDGVELAILYCYYGVESLSHPYFAAALATAVNRWLEDEWLSRDDRLRGSAVVTPQYPDAAVAEIERIGSDSRFAQILVPAGAAPGYGHPSYWPIWKAAARNGLAVAITYGGSTGSPPTTANWLGSFWEEYNTAILNVQSHVMSLAVSGIFTEVPDLRFVVAEGGWTWLPPFFWRLDHEWKSFQREVPWMKDRPPSAWVRDHFRFTTQPFDAPPTAAHLQDLLEQVGGVGMLMFGSDYPHTTGHPNDQLLDTLGADDADNVRHANAAAWYSF